MLHNVKIIGEPNLVKNNDNVLRSGDGKIIFKVCLTGDTGYLTKLLNRSRKNFYFPKIFVK
jgi:hypothetical protein